MSRFDGKDFGGHQDECQRQSHISLLTLKDNRIKDLERQLVEAREAEIEFLNRLYVYEENIASEREIINRVLKLKEQG